MDNRKINLPCQTTSEQMLTPLPSVCVSVFYMCVYGKVHNAPFSSPVCVKDVADTQTSRAPAVLSRSLLPPPPRSKLPAGGGRPTGRLRSSACCAANVDRWEIILSASLGKCANIRSKHNHSFSFLLVFIYLYPSIIAHPQRTLSVRFHTISRTQSKHPVLWFVYKTDVFLADLPKINRNCSPK